MICGLVDVQKFFLIYLFLGQVFKNIAAGLKSRWEALLSMETAVDKEASIAQQEGSASETATLVRKWLTFFFNLKRLKNKCMVCDRPPIFVRRIYF